MSKTLLNTSRQKRCLGYHDRRKNGGLRAKSTKNSEPVRKVRKEGTASVDKASVC